MCLVHHATMQRLTDSWGNWGVPFYWDRAGSHSHPEIRIPLEKKNGPDTQYAYWRMGSQCGWRHSQRMKFGRAEARLRMSHTTHLFIFPIALGRRYQCVYKRLLHVMCEWGAVRAAMLSVQDIRPTTPPLFRLTRSHGMHLYCI